MHSKCCFPQFSNFRAKQHHQKWLCSVTFAFQHSLALSLLILILHTFLTKIVDTTLYQEPDSKYKQVDISKVVTNQKHLTPNQPHDLHNILIKYEKLLIDLLVYNHTKRFTLIFSKVPNWCITDHILFLVFTRKPLKKNFNTWLILVFLKIWCLEWALPCFIIPKKDSCVRQISVLRSLNMCVKCKNTCCMLYKKTFILFQDTRISLILTLLCNITPLTSMTNLRTCVSLLQLFCKIQI